VAGQVIFDLIDGANQKDQRWPMQLEAGQEYPVEVLYQGRAGFNGICLGWVARNLQVEVSAAVELARDCDAIIFCGGFSGFSEGEGFDRTFAMQPEQEELLLALTAANPNVIAVLTGGGHIDMRRWLDRVRAVLHAWYPGDSGGVAVAEILAGAVSPSGRLPISCERNPEDRSGFACYHDADSDRRVLLADGVFTGYRHHDRTGVPPLFPFGFGLSYTTFAYENLQLEPVMKRGKTLKVRFDIVNTGKRAGTEVAQLYLSDIEASVPRPVKELKDFAAVTLKPGRRKTVTLTLKPRHLEFFSLERRKWVAELGEFVVSIGASAADIRLLGRFSYGE
jgi:beta-glucosidase